MAVTECDETEAEWHGFNSPGAAFDGVFGGSTVDTRSLLVACFPHSVASPTSPAPPVPLSQPIKRELDESTSEPQHFNWTKSLTHQHYIESSLFSPNEQQHCNGSSVDLMESDDQCCPVNMHVLAGSSDMSPVEDNCEYYYELTESSVSFAESLKNAFQNTVKRPRSLLSKSRDSSPFTLNPIAKQELLAAPNGVNNGDVLNEPYTEIMSQYHESFYKFHGRYPDWKSSRSRSQSRSPSLWSETLGEAEPIEFNEEAAASGLSMLSREELKSMHAEMSDKVSELSDVLVDLLTSRDQLQLEIEVRNDFIAAVLRLQELMQYRNARNQQQTKGKLLFKKTVSGQRISRHLDTVISYVPSMLGQSFKTIQFLTKVVEAVCADSSSLQEVLQEYMTYAGLNS